MSKYICHKCSENFVTKKDYTKHINKKAECKIIDNIIIQPKLKVDDKIIFPKPILKWVGGKTQILDTLIKEFPKKINNYHEIFLGGGSVLLAFLKYVNAGLIKIDGNVYVYDVNEPLINIYKNIQTNHNELFNKIEEFIKEYNECGDLEINRKPKTIIEAKQSKENYYYWMRLKYNELTHVEKNSIIGSAIFIFLNKTCFRGVFRVGPKGFNVPYGHYANPEIINKVHLDEIHDLIQNVVFKCSDFSESLNNVSDDDYVYLDPPYSPEKNTSFVGYTENGFNLDQHIKLFKECNNLYSKNIKIMMSNADVKLVRDYFTNDKHNIISIMCKRSINSKNPDAKAKEVIIKNY